MAVSKIYKGGTEVTDNYVKIYKGSTLLWEKESEPTGYTVTFGTHPWTTGSNYPSVLFSFDNGVTWGSTIPTDGSITQIKFKIDGSGYGEGFNNCYIEDKTLGDVNDIWWSESYLDGEVVTANFTVTRNSILVLYSAYYG